MQLIDAVKSYLLYIEKTVYKSPKTVDNYTRYLKRFVVYVGENFLTRNIDIQKIDSYRIALSKKNLSINTQSYHVIALRAFIKYCYNRKLCPIEPGIIELTQIQRPNIEFLKTDEIRSILDVNGEHTLIELRNKAIIWLLYSTGIRVGELVSLRRDQIDFEGCSFSVKGKRSKTRFIVMSEKTRDLLKRYLQNRIDDYPPLFISHSGKSSEDNKRLSSVMVELIVKESALKAHIQKRVTPHILRHSFATSMLKAGANIRFIQEILGHSSIITTQKYTHISNEDIRENYKKYLLD